MSKEEFYSNQVFTQEQTEEIRRYDSNEHYLPVDSDERWTLSGELFLKLLDSNKTHGLD